MIKTLEGKVAIVTGGSKGIGLAIARTLGRNGATVVICGRTAALIQEAVGALSSEGLTVRGVTADVGVPDQVDRLIATTVADHGRLDILVNNAGMGVFKKVEEMDIQDFDAMWTTNVRGVFLATRASLPHLMTSGAGFVVNISSLAGKNTFKGGAGYAATKWALRGFAGSLMLEVRDRNVRVATIFPGSVDTSFSSVNRRGDTITQAEDVADAVLFAVTAPGRTMISEIDIRPSNPK
jgi:3-oxoacyl-[acyl-carrier protein] reductase